MQHLTGSLVGSRFTRLLILERRSLSTAWAKCDCGKKKLVHIPNLYSGRTKSCGCLQRQRIADAKKPPKKELNVTTPMTDIKRMHALRPDATFNNFFKSVGYRAVRAHLAHLPEGEVLQRVSPSPGQPAVVMAHPLVALEFLRWLDHGLFLDRMAKVLEIEVPPKPTQPHE